MLNEVGMPPVTQRIQRRRVDVERESEPAEKAQAAGNQLVLSIIAFGSVLAVGLLLGWLIL